MRWRGAGWAGVVVILGCAGGSAGEDAASTGASSTAPGTTVAGPDSGDDGPDSSGTPSPTTAVPEDSSAGSEGPADTTAASDGGSTGEPVEEVEVHYVGRYDWSDPQAPRASWPGSSVRTRIDGTDLAIELDGAAGVFFQVVIDGIPTSVFETTGGVQTYPVAVGLPRGEHDVEIVRRNEGFFGSVAVVAVTPPEGTTIVPSPVVGRRIELIGDSLTAGYGIECDSGDQSFSGATENAYLTYGMVAARAVGAEATVVAHSGLGAAQNCCGNTDPTMPERYDRIFTDDPRPTWDFSSWVPDVVLVNLGTNDFSSAIDMGTFVDAYVALLQDVRAKNPSARIMAVTWANWGAEQEGWVHAAVAQAGEDDAVILQFSIDPADGYGCDFHTNVVTNAAFGQQLADALSLELGW